MKIFVAGTGGALGTQVVRPHALQAEAGLRAFFRWALVLRPLHDALVEDSLDQAERAILGGIASAANAAGECACCAS